MLTTTDSYKQILERELASINNALVTVEFRNGEKVIVTSVGKHQLPPNHVLNIEIKRPKMLEGNT